MSAKTPDPATVIKNVVDEATTSENVGVVVLCINKVNGMLALLSLNVDQDMTLAMLKVSSHMLNEEKDNMKGAH